ncbi:hypothetical protein D9758_001429 [Tetrapyrgos nigripes]|uniref:Uncharacterized protein n=1 Tax=Tetrapyrgos nigripes TaxID=182062 RepID=A0A8H5GS66_9AGAR|nr:hypothetical protein D9758_001429 [Tetrapyrgos nigripes]
MSALTERMNTHRHVSCSAVLQLRPYLSGLILLTNAFGNQAVHIAPEVFNAYSAEFEDQMDVWEAAFPDGITAVVKAIRGLENSSELLPIFGKLELHFAQQSLPLNDSVSLKVQRVNEINTDTNHLPYRSRTIEKKPTAFTDTASWRSGNFLVQDSDALQQCSKIRRQPSAAAAIDTY